MYRAPEIQPGPASRAGRFHRRRPMDDRRCGRRGCRDARVERRKRSTNARLSPTRRQTRKSRKFGRKSIVAGSARPWKTGSRAAISSCTRLRVFVVPPGLVAPGTSTITGPSATPVPAGGGPKPAGSTTQDDDGSACPKQENDVPNGPNFNGDEFEYAMSLLINPESPTPKQSVATPSVTSQAYFLPSATPAWANIVR